MVLKEISQQLLDGLDRNEDIHVPIRMNFGDPLTFDPVPPLSQKSIAKIHFFVHKM